MQILKTNLRVYIQLLTFRNDKVSGQQTKNANDIEGPYVICPTGHILNGVDLKIVRAIIKNFDIVADACGSENLLESLNLHARDLFAQGDKNIEKSWPTSYHSLMNVLRTVGYTDPKTLFVCYNSQHRPVTNKENKCCKCDATGLVPIHYCPLKDKIEKWVYSPKMCEKFTHFYRNEKEHWLRENIEEPFFPINEIWDGTRFAEVSWFFNPNQQYILPHFCIGCKYVIAVAEFIENSDVK